MLRASDARYPLFHPLDALIPMRGGVPIVVALGRLTR